MDSDLKTENKGMRCAFETQINKQLALTTFMTYSLVEKLSSVGVCSSLPNIGTSQKHKHVFGFQTHEISNPV